MKTPFKNTLWKYGKSYLLILFILILSDCSCRISHNKKLKYYHEAEAARPIDAIIVPGVPFEKGKWSSAMKGRVLWSVFLYRKGITKNIIYSGSAVYTPFVEGKIMALYAEALGVPHEHIFIDSLAEHSTENVYYSMKLAQKMGFKELGLATDPFQTKTLISFTKKLNAHIREIPFVEELLQTMSRNDLPIDSMQAYRPDFVSLVKRKSFFKRFRGTMGKNIQFQEGDLKKDFKK
ncbi:MAG: YdcF family protein [Bacteroidota bacterium]